jgi:hypothetical protein
MNEILLFNNDLQLKQFEKSFKKPNTTLKDKVGGGEVSK